MKKKLWGGRFKKLQDPEFEDFSCSMYFDYRLAKYDVLGSIAHSKMLGKCGIIPKKDAGAIIKGLNVILKEIEADKFIYDFTAEDIHTNIQNALEKKIGKPALKLHTARSRNDQVALDTRMYCRDKAKEIYDLVSALQNSLLDFTKENKDVIIPGLTHMQHAQPVLLSDQIEAYVWMLARDKRKLHYAYHAADFMPLGACALAGTSLKIDRKYVAKQLGFKALCENTMDAVSDRDFVIEMLEAASLIAMHLSRIASDLVLWTTPEFEFVQIDQQFCTGSSIMPQKVNPDFLELVRGMTGRIYGNLFSVLTMMKGLPLTYNRDMQWDKQPLFDSVEKACKALSIFAKMIKGIKVNKANIERALLDESLYATDLAEYLVAKGLDSRQAHSVIGKLVATTLERKRRISALTLSELKKFSDKFEKDALKLLDPKVSVASRKKGR
ncbi:MAG: argininosuccinate lyase [Omnitrophica WOR_2 bacterium RIFCSPHIGHO2_01_FULL_49_10]|nr:MAG: argininosuccinate lyase [Omnitrophica WOR_2 bacterium RIFCSPHIGHO2_01_FULL_49_10]